MTPEERDALIGYVAEIERFALQYARQFEALKYLLLEQGVITADGIERAVKTVEAAFLGEEATDPRLKVLAQLRKRIAEQK